MKHKKASLDLRFHAFANRCGVPIIVGDVGATILLGGMDKEPEEQVQPEKPVDAQKAQPGKPVVPQ